MGEFEFKKRKRPVSSMSYPVKGEAGKTGSWRTHRPVLNIEKCTAAKKGEMVCMQCWLYCPEACISKAVPPKIDYDYCKGCLVCVSNCPTGALEAVEESEAEEMDQ
jgi:pyruvate ferredoxin oxidoreductase delta subunit